jgi:hypothetical protein
MDRDEIALKALRKALEEAVGKLPDHYFRKETRSCRPKWAVAYRRALEALNG